MPMFSITDHLRDLGIDVLDLSRRARNGLLRAGIRTLGDFHGKTIAEIGALRGIGASCLEEIASAVQRAHNASDYSGNWHKPALVELTAEATVEDTAEEHARVLHVPEVAMRWPVSALDLPARVRGVLVQRGIALVGDLDGMSELDLVRLQHVGASGTRYIVNAVEELTTLPDASVLRRTAAGELASPNAPLGLFFRVAHARTPMGEINALFQELPDRTSKILRQRWARKGRRNRTLEEIAHEFGITRERVRQIVAKQEQLFRTSNLWLPRLARVVDLLDVAGGALPTQRLMQEAATNGYPVDGEVLSYVEALGSLGLIPRATYDDRARLWLTPKGSAIWVPDGRLAQPLRETRRTIGRSLQRTGCIAVKSLEGAPFGVRHAISIGLHRGEKLDRVGGYFIPRKIPDCVLARWAREMLAVTPELSLDDLAGGLRKGMVVYRGRRVGIGTPPSAVLREVLTRDGRFVLANDRIRMASPVSRQEVLSATEQVVVAAIERLNNVATWAQVLEAGEAAGCATATVTLALVQPFIVRRGAGIYALRGREVAPEALRARIRERAAMRREAVKRVSYTGGTRARVVYELTNFSMSGVLPVPNKLRGLANRSWRARLPGGRELRVKMKSGFIWPLHPWITADHLKRGDLIVADFDIANGVIELDVAS